MMWFRNAASTDHAIRRHRWVVWRAAGLGCALGCAVAAWAQLPEGCKVPADRERALHDNPTSRTYGEAGAWFAGEGDLKCALAAFDEAVRLEPNSPLAHYNLGVAHERAGQLPAAAAEYRLALRLKPGMTAAHNSLGSVLVRMGEGAAAEAQFREALRLDPDSVPALDQLARRLAAGRHYESAIHHWKRALALQPDSTGMALSMGLAASQGGDPDEAIRVLAGLVKAHPEMKAAHLALADIYAHESMFREAADEYGEAVRLDPGDDAARSREAANRLEKTSAREARLQQLAEKRRKAGELRLAGQPAQAAALYRQMLQIDPRDARTEVDLALALGAAHDQKGERETLEQAIKVEPRMAAALAELGRLDLAAGNRAL
ncbi:MAG TPA: tetratricopeptide repeat protein, partial [Burkholderiaceae bacterium]